MLEVSALTTSLTARLPAIAKVKPARFKSNRGEVFEFSNLWLSATEAEEILLSNRQKVTVLSPSDFGQKRKCID